MKSSMRLFFCTFMIACVLALLLGCGGGSGDGASVSGVEDCYWDYMVGPAGAVLTIDDPDSPTYGLTVEVAPGELDICRTFYIADDNLNVSFTPFLPSGFLSWPKRNEGVFEIKTSGDPPYDAEITMTLPLSDTDLNVSPGQIICAFYFDKAVDSWRFVLPQSIDEVNKTMTVLTKYREVWNWGRVDLQKVDQACLESALKDQMGQSALAELISEIDGIIEDIENENISVSSCTSLRSLQSGLLETLRTGAEARLMAADINPICGLCDPLSKKFMDELKIYISNNFQIFWSEVFIESTRSIMLKFALQLNVLISYNEIWNLDCDFSCVWDELGIGFWLDFAEYHLAVALQYMIDYYIALTPSMNC